MLCYVHFIVLSPSQSLCSRFHSAAASSCCMHCSNKTARQKYLSVSDQLLPNSTFNDALPDCFCAYLGVTRAPLVFRLQ